MENGSPRREDAITTVSVAHAAVSLTCGRFLYVFAEPPDRWREETVASMRPEQDMILGICLDSRTAATHDIARTAVEALRRAGHVSSPVSEDLQFVIGELIANAHLHGNLRDVPPSDAPDAYFRRGISLSVARQEGQIRLTVSNQSPDALEMPARPRKEQSALCGMPAGGMGLKIIEAMGGRIVHSEDMSRWTVTFSVP